jgi:GR25 family glycosyltransferase involved in LPS biosynthesis
MMAACISYREVYSKLLNDSECDMYVILEDDVTVTEYALGMDDPINSYMNNLPSSKDYDVAFLDRPRYLSANTDNIKYGNNVYSCFSKVNFGRNHTHAITKRGATKFLMHYNKWIYKSPEDHLSRACSQGIFSDIILPFNPIFCYTDNFPSTKVPVSLEKDGRVEWYTDEYKKSYETITMNKIQSFTRNPNNLTNRFYGYNACNDNLLKQPPTSREFEAFWINVEKQTERAEFMVKELDTCKILHTRVSACTPETMPVVHAQPNCYVSKLEYACMCSHVFAYQTALESNVDWFLILEDDMIIYKNTQNVQNTQNTRFQPLENLRAILSNRPKDSECLQLFCSNPDVQRILVTASIDGKMWIPLNEKFKEFKDFWGACSYFISRKAAQSLVNRYVKIVDGNINIDFKSLSHPINPEAVPYSHLKCYSHTRSIFTTREDIGSIVHVQSDTSNISNSWIGHTEHNYCNYVVRERINYDMNKLDFIYGRSLTTKSRDASCIVMQDTSLDFGCGTTSTKYEEFTEEHHTIYDLAHKTFIFIIGANSFTSGAFELASILNKDPYWHLETESHEMLPWEVDTDKLDKKLRLLSKRDYPKVGDTGHYYINYVKHMMGENQSSPRFKFVYLDCEIEESVKNFMDTTPCNVNYWTNGEYEFGDRNSDTPPFIISSEYDITYPKYDTSHTKSESAKKYCEEHKMLAKTLEINYPPNFRIFNYANTKDKDHVLRSIYDFLGSPKRVTR